jgi:glycosyltransferase involved in cell wall biosynthesis
MKLSVVVPAYNEERTISRVLQKICDVQLIHSFEKEIIVVDDASRDNTEQIVKQFMLTHPDTTIHYFKQESNQGKGAAIHTGIRIASGEYLIVQDADLEYDPIEFNTLLTPIVDGHADVVYGSRFTGGKPQRILFFWHSFGNKYVLTFLSNMMNNLNLTDMETCYKLFRTDIIKRLHLAEKRFGFEPEVTAKIAKIKGIRIYEVGISYYGRTYEEGKKINWKDGIRAIYCIFRYGLFR